MRYNFIIIFPCALLRAYHCKKGVDMAYYIDLFSPETYAAFTSSDRGVSGFRMRQKGIAAAVRPGDKLLCYMTKLSRWVGVLEVVSEYFLDDTPVFLPAADPF